MTPPIEKLEPKKTKVSDTWRLHSAFTAKRARRRTRLEKAAADRNFLEEALMNAARVVAGMKEILKKFADESNWALKDDAETAEKLLLWLSDDDPTELARKALKEIGGGNEERAISNS